MKFEDIAKDPGKFLDMTGYTLEEFRVFCLWFEKVYFNQPSKLLMLKLIESKFMAGRIVKF